MIIIVLFIWLTTVHTVTPKETRERYLEKMSIAPQFIFI